MKKFQCLKKKIDLYSEQQQQEKKKINSLPTLLSKA